MIGLLAVPVAVLLLVVVLALIGGRWTPSPEPLDEVDEAEDVEELDDEELAAPWPADPWRPVASPAPQPLAPAPLRYALPAGPPPSRDLLPAPRPYHPPAPPPARPSFGVLSREPRDVPPGHAPDPGYGQGSPYGPYPHQ